MKWDLNEIELLKNRYFDSVDDELLKLFPNRNLVSIKLKAKRLKLKKSKGATFKNRSNSRKGEKNGMFGKTSSKKNKKYDVIYGVERADNLKIKLSESRTGKGGMIGEKNPMFGKPSPFKGIRADKVKIEKYKLAQRKYWDNLTVEKRDKRILELKELWVKTKEKYKEIDTIPEQLTEKILNDLGIKYEKKKIIGYYSCDFVLSDKTIVEVQGDYWHANPTKYNLENLDKIQKRNIERDKAKKTYLLNLGYKIIYLWEYDLKKNIETCKTIIKNGVN